MKIKISKLILLIISIILYLASLLFPAFGCNYFGAGFSRYMVQSGYELLHLGWMGIFVLNFGWLANATYIIALVLVFISNSRDAFYFAIASLFLGSSSLLIYFDKANERVGLYLGFYLWITSFVLLTISTSPIKTKLTTPKTSN